MQKTLLASDLHLSATLRDSYRWGFFDWLIRAIQDNLIDRLILTGDLTEHKDGHNAYLVNKIVDQLAALSKYCDIVLLRGNHDGLTPTNPFFAFIDQIPHITWISAPRRIDKELFLPHTDDYKRDWGPLKKDFAACARFFCHQTFTGALSETGFKLEGVPTNIFPAGAEVYSGDIHAPQSVGPVTYIGAPYTVRFGDVYNPRVLVLEAGRPPRSIPVPGPQKRLLEINHPSQLTPELANPHDLVKIRVNLPVETTSTWSDVRHQIALFAEKQEWLVVSITPVTNLKLTTRTALVRQVSTSDSELLKVFAKRQSLGATLLKTGLEFLE